MILRFNYATARRRAISFMGRRSTATFTVIRTGFPGDLPAHGVLSAPLTKEGLRHAARNLGIEAQDGQDPH